MLDGLYAQSSKGYALLIGLSTVDNDAYLANRRRTYGKEAVMGVENDIDRMTKMLEDYQLSILRNQEATNVMVLKRIREIGKIIKPGDTFVLYFSGHGDQVPDKNHDEPDSLDEVLVAYNDYVLDDSLQLLFGNYFKQTNNIMIVDACHSSSSYKNMMGAMHDYEKRSAKGKTSFVNENTSLKKDVSQGPCFYEQTTEVNEPYPLIYYGAAGDYAKAVGDSYGGLLTKTMVGYFQYYKSRHILSYLTYQNLACQISKSLRFQTLQYHEIGPLSDKLKNEIPFKIISP